MIAILLVTIVGTIPISSGTDLYSPTGVYPPNLIDINRPSPTKISNKVHFFKDVGLLLEPHGQYYTHSGFSITPLIYQYPTMKVNHYKPEDNCTNEYVVRMAYNNARGFVQSLMPGLDQELLRKGSRSKRSIAIPILLGAELGMSLYNTYKVNDFQSGLNAVEDNEEKIKKVIQRLNDTQVVMLDKLNQAIFVIGDHASMINKLAEDIACIHTSDFISASLFTQQITMSSMEFIQAMNGALTGNLLPSLLPPSSALRMLNDHREFRNSPYKQDMKLLYELSKVIVVGIDSDPSPHFKCLIMTPKISHYGAYPLYLTHAVNFNSPAGNVKVDVPTLLACNDDMICWPVLRDKCQEHVDKVICSSGSLNYVEPCIMGIRMNDTSKCNYIPINSNEALIFQTGVGVLIGSTNKPIKIGVYKDNVFIAKEVHDRLTSPLIVNSYIGSTIIYNNDIYSNVVQGIVYNITTVINLNQSYTLSAEFAGLVKAKNISPISMSQYFDDLNLKTLDNGNQIILIWSIFSTAVVVIIVCYLCFMRSWQYPRSYGRRLQNINDIQNIMG